VDVVHPLDLGPERVHDLLVQQLLAEEDLVAPCLERPEGLAGARLQAYRFVVQALDLRPVELPEAFLPAPADGQARDLGEELAHRDLEVGQLPDVRSVGVDHGPAEELREIDEEMGVRVERLEDRNFVDRHRFRPGSPENAYSTALIGDTIPISLFSRQNGRKEETQHLIPNSN